MIIFNADDFGMSANTNRAICEAFQHGCLTSTSVLANMPGFEDAVKCYAAIPELPVGAHISLNMGRPVLPADEVSQLIGPDGNFIASYCEHIRRGRNDDYLRQAGNEIRAQVVKLRDYGFQLDHINSQSHIHMIEPLFRVFQELKEELQIPQLRCVREKWWPRPLSWNSNIAKVWVVNLASRGAADDSQAADVEFRGLHESNNMVKNVLLRYLKSYRGRPMEILSHPGYVLTGECAEFQSWVQTFLVDEKRQLELEALLDEEVNAEIARRRIRTGSFADLSSLAV